MLGQHLNLIRTVSKLTVQFGVHKVMRDAITLNTTVVTATDKALVFVGGMAISSVVTHHAWEHADPVVIKTVETIDEIRTRYHEAKNPPPATT